MKTPAIQLFAPSAELSRVIGTEPVTKPEAVERFWEYVRAHGLQQPGPGTKITADEALRAVFGNSPINLFLVPRVLDRHLRRVEATHTPVVPPGMLLRADGEGKGPFYRRYLDGDHAGVWAELTALKMEVHRPEYLGDAWDVARETMRRVKSNVEVLRERLTARGYRLARPEPAHVSPDDLQCLDELEAKVGPLPISLRAFYETVGPIDLTQSAQQIDMRDASGGRLESLGHFSPLAFYPAHYLLERATRERTHFMPDDAEKAHFSGGIVEIFFRPHADAPLGLFEPWEEELFVPYLRTAFSHAGFAGRVDPTTRQILFPQTDLIAELADGLLPV
ncbi:MAG: SWIB/MDM2 domain-containing protein [Myxococcaceae bacterium]